jgi:hypothetical protein
MMIIAPSSFRDIISDVIVHLNGVVIKRVQFMRILGVLFDENIPWCRHVKKVVSGCNLTLRSLYPIQNLLSTNSKKIVISALVLSQINFASILWIRQRNYKTIDLLITKCARNVFNLLKYDSVTELVCNELGWFFSKTSPAIRLLN